MMLIKADWAVTADLSFSQESDHKSWVSWCWQLVDGQKAQQGFRKTFSQPQRHAPPSPAMAASQHGNPEKTNKRTISRKYRIRPHTNLQSGRGTWPESWSWMSTYRKEPPQAGALKAGSLREFIIIVHILYTFKIKLVSNLIKSWFTGGIHSQNQFGEQSN